MSDLNPFTSTFTRLGLSFIRGAKITKEQLNQIVNNTGFNWLGGRHPMREAFGEFVVTLNLDTDEVEIVIGETTTTADLDNGLLSPIQAEISISSRIQGVSQFSAGHTYQTFLTMVTARQINYVINTGQEAFETLLDIPKDFFNMTNLSVASQENDRFTLRLDVPQPQFSGGSTELTIGWFAKGY